MDFQKSIATSSFCVIVWWLILFFLPQHITTPVFLLANAEYVSGNFRKAVMILNTGIPVNTVPIQWVCSYFLSLSFSPLIALNFYFQKLCMAKKISMWLDLCKGTSVSSRRRFSLIFSKCMQEENLEILVWSWNLNIWGKY